MVKIHWSIYIILGAAVLFVSNKLDPQKFKLFIWFGYLFLVVGVAKLGIWFISRKRESAVERKDILKYSNKGMRQQQRVARYCQRCGNPLRGYENFCPRCGQRLG